MDNRFLLALSITVLVETAVLIAGSYFLLRSNRPSIHRMLFAGFLASSWSLPYFWFLLPRFVSGKAYLPVGEGLVILGEAVILRFILDLGYFQCLMLSALCNLCSMIVGMVLLNVMG